MGTVKLNQDGISQEDKQLATAVRNKLIAGDRVIGDPGEGLRQTLVKLEKQRDNYKKNMSLTEWEMKDVELESQISMTKAGIEGEEKLCHYLEQLVKYDDKLEGLVAFASLSYQQENNDKEYIPDTDTLLVYGNNLLIIDAKNLKVKPNQALMVTGGVIVDADKGKEILEVHPSTQIWQRIMVRAGIPIDTINGYVCIVGDTPVEIIRDDEWHACQTKLIHISELKDILEEWIYNSTSKELDGSVTISLRLLTEIAKCQIKKEKDISFDIAAFKQKFGV